MGVVLFPGPGLGPLATAAGGATPTPVNVFTRPFVAWLTPRAYNINTTADVYRSNSVTVPPTARKDSFRTGPFTWNGSGSGARLAVANYRVIAGVANEDAAAPVVTIRHAALEYPAGVLHEASFAGSVSCTLNAGDSWESGGLGFNFVKGEPYWVRLFAESAGTDLPAHNAQFGPAGTGVGQSGDQADHVLDAADPVGVFNLLTVVTNTPQVYLYTHLAVTGDASGFRVPVGAGLGDSILAGSSAGKGGAGHGFAQNTIEDQGSYFLNMGSPGESLSQVVGNALANSAVRRRVAKNCDGVFVGYLTNDLRGGRTVPQMEADAQTLLADLVGAGKPIWWFTPVPFTNDLVNHTWVAPASNQTEPAAGVWAARQAVRAWLLSPPAGLTQGIDTGDAVASAPGGDRWHVNTTPSSQDWTINDGVHPGNTAVDAMETKATATNPQYLGPVPPNVSFTGTPLTGNAPLSVAFTDTSLYLPTSWHWQKSSDHGATWSDFAGTPTAQNPTESFADLSGTGAGTTWSVRLTAQNASAVPVTSTRIDYVGAGVWTPASLPNLVLYLEGDIGGSATAWADQSGLSHNLAGSGFTVVNAALNGHKSMKGNAVSALLTAAFTYNQPATVYLVARVNSAAGNAAFMDGGANLGFLLDSQSGASPITVRLYSGSGFTAGSAMTVGTWYTVKAVNNGASSSLTFNEGTPTTGNAGAANPGGLTLNNRQGGGFPGDGEFACVVAVTGTPSAGDETKLNTYLRARFGHY